MERLQELIDQHRQTGTVKQFLTGVNTLLTDIHNTNESECFIGEYQNIDDIDTSRINVHDLPVNTKLKVKLQVSPPLVLFYIISGEQSSRRTSVGGMVGRSGCCE